MTPPAVGTGTLRRLSALDTGGHPVLSVYLGLESGRSLEAAAEARERELDGAIAEIEQGAMQVEVGRLHEVLRSMPALAPGTRSLALFSSAQGATVAAVPLPSPIEPMAVIDTLAWLEPLAGIFTPGDNAVAVIDRHAGRLFRGAPRMLVEFATVRDQHHCKPTPGDCSGPTRCSPTEERLAEHAGRLASLLLRAHRRRAFDQLVLIAPRELWRTAEGALHSDLRGRLTALIDLDFMDAPAQEITRAVAQHAHVQRTERCGRSSQTALPAPTTIKITPDANDLALV
jgi:protein required for attachment to host cells